jgi:hypothetical protein
MTKSVSEKSHSQVKLNRYPNEKNAGTATNQGYVISHPNQVDFSNNAENSRKK